MTPIDDFLKIQLVRLEILRRPTDVYIISYPKSGRTWLRVLIGKAICLTYRLPDEMMLDTHKLTTTAGLLRTHFVHDYSEILSGLHYRRLPAHKGEYASKKVIFIVRDIKDTLVSSYFQATKRTYKFKGTISEFVRSETYGVKKIVAFYNVWYNNQTVPKDFLLLRYEDMHHNPAEALVKALRFMGLEPIEDRIVQEAVAFASFNNMKKMEAGGYFNDPKMRPGDAKDEESYKVRKGVVGGYTTYLSEEDIQYIDQAIEEMGCPFMQTQPSGHSAQAKRQITRLYKRLPTDTE
jgi:hypothetical protein